ncbi:MAG: PD-(D/E)XK nuclease family transposase, partial [Oscillospiraceae bacterium]|nr:PD-(D/E)XK nuclease family transposase [Oscillospiraceae bacterium]
MKIEHESLIGTYEQKKAQVQGFNLMHDDFFAVVMQHKEALEVVLRILLQKKTLKVKEVRIQYTMRNIIGHSATLDVLAEDDTGNLYNVEVQVKNDDNYQKRVRYYQAN